MRLRELQKQQQDFVTVRQDVYKRQAWIYLDDHGLEEIDVQMTYAHLDTEMIKRFRETMTREELESWYQRLLDSYHKWLSYQMKWREERNRSMEDVDKRQE